MCGGEGDGRAGGRGLSPPQTSQRRSRQPSSPAVTQHKLVLLARSWLVLLAGVVPLFLCLWSSRGYEEGLSVQGERHRMRDGCNYMEFFFFFFPEMLTDSSSSSTTHCMFLLRCHLPWLPSSLPTPGGRFVVFSILPSFLDS